MSAMLLQDVAVTLVALSAAFVLIRNTVAMFRPSRNGSACTSCGPTCAGSQPKGPASTVVPLTLVRRQKS